jgi:hypothetical protein
METLVFTRAYAAFSGPLTLNLTALLSLSCSETTNISSQLQETFDALFPSESTRAIDEVTETGLNTAQVTKTAKYKKRFLYSRIISMATEWAGSGRCKFFLNEKTGLHEPIIETQSP